MLIDFLARLSEITGLPPAVLICALVIVFFLIVFGILVLLKVRNIIKVLNSVNFSLDSILNTLAKQSGQFARKTTRSHQTGPAAETGSKMDVNTKPTPRPRKPAAGFSLKNQPVKNSGKIQLDNRRRIETENSEDGTGEQSSGEYAIKKEVRAKIYDLLKKTAKPTPYHELAAQLSRNYPGFDYDYFLKEIEALQKAGKVDVRLLAEKLYVQIKK